MAQKQTIHIMPPALVERIAAGEVVERPTSVVKELIENSLDAGAQAINVEIRTGGLTLIRVSDDGCGMNRVDAPLALARNATSKVRTAADLETITTLGFRGEALSSIAAVARLEILTRTAEELEGTRIQSPDLVKDVGQSTSDVVRPAASPVGTSITVRDLFYNTPARRKFLKAPTREAELVRDTVVRYALAYPGVAFRLVADGRERLVAPPASPLERIGLCLGREVAAEMLEINWTAGELGISGFISRPTIGRSRRQGQFFSLNDRPIRSGLLAVMLERAYAGRLPSGRYPLAVVRIALDPLLVDVNVHPRKAEVRFAQERAVYQALTHAVEDALSPFPRQFEFPGYGPAVFASTVWPFDSEMEVLKDERQAYVIAGGVQALGQVLNTYIIARSIEGLVVVDQHAGHEQVLFERLSAGASHHTLLSPTRLSLTTREAETLRSALLLLTDLGFEIEPFGDNSFLVRALPEPLTDQSPEELLTGLVEELHRLRDRNPDAIREGLAMKAACTAAVKAGDYLSIEEQQTLLDNLMHTWSPATCPHGRPAFFTLTREELERRFLRR